MKLDATSCRSISAVGRARVAANYQQHTSLLLSIDGTDRQTDGRTDGHRTDIGPLHRSGRGVRFSDVPHASSYTGCYEVTNSPKCQSDLATGRIGAAERPCYMVSVAFFLPVCLCLALVSGINSRLLSANHALISPILPHPVL